MSIKAAMARLEIIMGCMFSGKTTELIRRITTLTKLDKNILVVNSSVDTRSSRSVVKTHDDVTFDCIKTNVLMTLDIHNVDVIAIDEAQFFKDLDPFIVNALNTNKHVIVSGLDGDSNQQKFGQLIDLIPRADTVTKLHAVCTDCNDGTPASFSKRCVDDTQQELVGTSDKYKAVCRKHL
jgi:thymidine kinase